MIEQSKNTFPVILFFFVVLFYIPGSAQVHPVAMVDNLVRSGIEDVLNQKYSSAELTFKKLETEYPRNPLGKIFLVAGDIFENQDLGKPFNTNLAMERLDKAEELADALLDSDENNVWYKYYKSLVLSYRAIAKGVTGNWISALSAGYSAKNSFEDCVKLHNGFYDAYVAIGTWKYWSSEKMEFLTWLPFVHDERSDGIAYLQKAVKGNSYHYYFASHTLARIYIFNKQAAKAVPLITPLLQSFPESRFFMWDIARAYEDIDKNRAIREYQKLLSSYQKAKLPNNARVYFIYYILAKLHNNIGDLANAKVYMLYIPPFEKMSEFERSELTDKFERIEKLRKILK